jgi:hypothetical protein
MLPMRERDMDDRCMVVVVVVVVVVDGECLRDGGTQGLNS